jgi:hypothetical protein
MFYQVQVLDSKGKLKKLFTSEMLSKRHWELFPDNIKKSEKDKKSKTKKKNKFNAFKTKKLLATGS